MATDTTDQKYLSLEGLKIFWDKIKDHVNTENAKIKVSFSSNGTLTKFTPDATGRIITVDETELVNRLNAIDGASGTVAGLDSRLNAIEDEIDTLQTTAIQDGKGVDGKHTTTTVEKDADKVLNIKVDVATVGADQYSTETDTGIPTAGSVMSKINAAIAALNANQIEGTDINKIVTGVTQTNGKIDVTSVIFNAITDEEINGLS